MKDGANHMKDTRTDTRTDDKLSQAREALLSFRLRRARLLVELHEIESEIFSAEEEIIELERKGGKRR